MPDHRALLHQTADLAADYLAGIEQRHVGTLATREALAAALGGPLPAHGEAPADVLARLARGADPGVVASAGPRYFGFVTGGSLPAALAADWLAGAWDQNGFAWVMSPAGAVVEEIAAAWLVDLFGLPPSSSVGFTTGATMANFTGLLAARHRVLARAGWDVERDGLQDAPSLRVVVGAEAHATILAALQMAGLGAGRALRIEADAQGRMRSDLLREQLATLHDSPVIVFAQAGNVNTGAVDPLGEIVRAVRTHANAWLHVDGAFGLWAATSPTLRPLCEGCAGADSWATDAHKWLNVPYDCGVAIVSDPQAHRAAVSYGAAYYAASGGELREPGSWVPDSSRRSRAFAVYAALRQLGRDGVADLVDGCCRLARCIADSLRDAPGVVLLNEVVLNQVLVRFVPRGAATDDVATLDAHTKAVIADLQRDGTCWAGGTTWRGMAALRLSVSNWSTTDRDVDLCVAAILRCARAVA